MTALSLAMRSLKSGLAVLGLELRRIRPAGESGRPRFSNFGEETLVRSLLAKTRPRERFCVDIGAGDGETSSNTCFLFRDGWDGLSVEWDGGRFARMAHRYAGLRGARLLRARVTPDNAVALLSGAEVPREFGFLSLDIDGYDYFVLESVLRAYRPAVICAEINEKIPPPLRFTVKWRPDHAWAQDHFYGQSLSLLEDLAGRHGYVLAGLEYNNAFLVPSGTPGVTALSAGDAYRSGYLDRPDRLEKLPWNRDMEALHALDPEGMADFVRRRFAAYEGRYLLATGPLAG